MMIYAKIRDKCSKDPETRRERLREERIRRAVEEHINGDYRLPDDPNLERTNVPQGENSQSAPQTNDDEVSLYSDATANGDLENTAPERGLEMLAITVPNTNIDKGARVLRKGEKRRNIPGEKQPGSRRRLSA